MARWQGQIEAELVSVWKALEWQKEMQEVIRKATDKATDLAADTSLKWRESANEWRGAMADRDRELPSRREIDAQLDAIRAVLDVQGDMITTMRARREQRQEESEAMNQHRARVIAFVAVAASTIVGLAAVLTAVLTTH